MLGVVAVLACAGEWARGCGSRTALDLSSDAVGDGGATQPVGDGGATQPVGVSVPPTAADCGAQTGLIVLASGMSQVWGIALSPTDVLGD